MVVRIHLGQQSKELWQTWCMRRTENPENVVQLHEAPQKTALWYNGSTTGFGSVSEGSTPSGATKVLHGVMVAYQISVLEVVVRIHLEQVIWSLWPRGLGASLWHLSTQVRILSNSLRWSVHLTGQDYRFSICPHEFDPRTDYEMLQ